jgi:alpha-mannosidase
VADGNGAVMITAVKGWEAPGADVIVRAVETLGRPASARLELPVLGRAIEAEFGPSQIRTFRVPADGGPVVEVDLLERDQEPSRPFAAVPVEPAVSGADQEPDHQSSDATQPAEEAAPGQRRLRRD